MLFSKAEYPLFSGAKASGSMRDVISLWTVRKKESGAQSPMKMSFP